MSSVEGSVLRNSLPFFQNLLDSLVSMTIERLLHPIGLIEGVQQVMSEFAWGASVEFSNIPSYTWRSAGMLSFWEEIEVLHFIKKEYDGDGI